MSATVGTYAYILQLLGYIANIVGKGIFQGHSTLLLGKIQNGEGIQVDVYAGDVIVLPAGTAHSSLRSSDDYRYIGVYPRVSIQNITCQISPSSVSIH